MGGFTPVLEGATLPVFHPGEELALRRAGALELVGNDDAGRVLQALEPLTEQLLRRVLVPAALPQNLQHGIILIHRTPQVMPFATDRSKHLGQVPGVARLGPSTL
jgi:hypothetical protein